MDLEVQIPRQHSMHGSNLPNLWRPCASQVVHCLMQLLDSLVPVHAFSYLYQKLRYCFYAIEMSMNDNKVLSE